MIYCGKCGKASPAGTKFCGGCGAPLTVVEEVKAPVVEPTPVVEQPTYQEAKCWKIFGRVGFGLSIATLVCAVTFVFSYLALAIGQFALPFSILGMRSKLPANKSKAKVGIILSSVGIGLGLILYIIFIIVFGFAFANGIGSGNDIASFAKIFA